MWGKVYGSAAEVLDADGLIVAPGLRRSAPRTTTANFLGPAAQRVSEHGVTTVVMGNCGVGVAPCRPRDHDLLIEDLINVEGMVAVGAGRGIRWNWDSFGDYLAMAQRSTAR